MVTYLLASFVCIILPPRACVKRSLSAVVIIEPEPELVTSAKSVALIAISALPSKSTPAILTVFLNLEAEVEFPNKSTLLRTGAVLNVKIPSIEVFSSALIRELILVSIVVEKLASLPKASANSFNVLRASGALLVRLLIAIS